MMEIYLASSNVISKRKSKNLLFELLFLFNNFFISIFTIFVVYKQTKSSCLYEYQIIDKKYNKLNIFRQNIFQSWEDFYDETKYMKKNNEYFTNNTFLLSSNAYILNCHFIDISSFYLGGAISILGGPSKILIEKSSFYNCKSNIGGALFLSTVECVLQEICGVNCSGECSFCYINASSEYAHNFVYQSSINQCKSRINTMYFNNGNISMHSLNESFNIGQIHSGMFCISQSNNKFQFSFSTFSNNTAQNMILHFVHSPSETSFSNRKKFEIIFSNIIFNSGGLNSNNGIITVSDSDLDLINSCIMRNIGKYDCYISKGSGRIINCSLDNQYFNKFNGFTLYSGIKKEGFVLVLSFLSTEKCYSEYDIIPGISITEIIIPTLNKTIKRTPQKTQFPKLTEQINYLQRRRRKYNENIYQLENFK